MLLFLLFLKLFPKFYVSKFVNINLKMKEIDEKRDKKIIYPKSECEK